MFNNTMFLARYASYLTLCLRAALKLNVVGQHAKGAVLSTEKLAKRLGLNPVSARSFFNVLTALGILEHRNGYETTDDADSLLQDSGHFAISPYLSLGLEQDSGLDEFIAFLQRPSTGTPLYTSDAAVSVMDDPNGAARQIAYGLASRAKRFSDPLAQLITNRAGSEANIQDFGAGSPYLAAALLCKLPNCNVTLADRENATRFIRSMANENGIAIQAPGTELHAGQIGILNCNIFVRETLPRAHSADVIVLSNVLHDWTLEEIPLILRNAVICLKQRGSIVVHETLLGDGNHEHQLWMAAYGMGLNHLTGGKGSCYSLEEYDPLFKIAGLKRTSKPVETRDGCMAVFYEPLV